MADGKVGDVALTKTVEFDGSTFQGGAAGYRQQEQEQRQQQQQQQQQQRVVASVAPVVVGAVVHGAPQQVVVQQGMYVPQGGGMQALDIAMPVDTPITEAMDLGRRRVHVMAGFSVFCSVVSFITPGIMVPPVDIVIGLIAAGMAVHHTYSSARLRQATRGFKHQACGCGIACVHSMALSGAIMCGILGLGRLALNMSFWRAIVYSQSVHPFIAMGMISGVCSILNVVILSSIASYTRSDRKSCTCCCAPPSAVLGDVSPAVLCCVCVSVHGT